MQTETTLDRLIKVVNEAMDGEFNFPKTITAESRFAEDLGCDSFDLVHIEIDIEEEFGITLGGNGLLSDIVTIGDAVALIERSLTPAGSASARGSARPVSE